MANKIKASLFLKQKTSTRVSFLSITSSRTILGDGVSAALPGYHAFTGCDSVSAFAGRGKKAGLQLLKSDPRYQNLFVKLGERWEVNDELFEKLEKFTYQMYDKKTKCTNVNDLRFELFVKRKGKIESQQLPPCKDCLRKHCLRANYQAGI